MAIRQIQMDIAASPQAPPPLPILPPRPIPELISFSHFTAQKLEPRPLRRLQHLPLVAFYRPLSLWAISA